MAVRNDWTDGEVLYADDLNDTIGEQNDKISNIEEEMNERLIFLDKKEFSTGSSQTITGLDYTKYRFYKVYFHLKSNVAATRDWLGMRLNSISSSNSYTTSMVNGSGVGQETTNLLNICGFENVQSAAGEFLIECNNTSGVNIISGNATGHRTDVGFTNFVGGRLNAGANITSITLFSRENRNMSGYIKVYGIK